MSESERKEQLRGLLEGNVQDLVGDLLYYDRKRDEDLPLEDLEEMLDKGWVTVDELVEWFRAALEMELDGYGEDEG